MNRRRARSAHRLGMVRHTRGRLNTGTERRPRSHARAHDSCPHARGACVDPHTRPSTSTASVVPRPLGEGALVIDTFIAELQSNDYAVHGPLPFAAATGCVVSARTRSDRASRATPTFPSPALPKRSVRSLPTRRAGPSGSPRLRSVSRARASPSPIRPRSPSWPRPGPSRNEPPPLTHICVVHTTDLVPSLAGTRSPGSPPTSQSALTWVGGPSRTGDLEMILTLGVHGPRIVEVVLIDG